MDQISHLLYLQLKHRTSSFYHKLFIACDKEWTVLDREGMTSMEESNLGLGNTPFKLKVSVTSYAALCLLSKMQAWRKEETCRGT